MSTPNLTPSFRQIANIPEGAAHDSVIKAIRFLVNSTVDLQSAIPVLTNQVAGHSSIITTIRTGGGSSPPPPPNLFPGLGGVDNQSGVTSYTTTSNDNGAILVLSDASAIAVSLFAVTNPYFLTITNIGAGTATLTPATGTINGAGSISLDSGYFAIAYFDGSNWWGATIPVAGGGGGVTSLQGETGAVSLTSSGGTVAITTPSSSTINLEATGGTGTGILKGTVTLSWSAGPFLAHANATVTGATTTMSALLMIPPATSSGSSWPIEQGNLSADVVSANTVNCLYNVPSGLPSGGPTTFPIIVFT